MCVPAGGSIILKNAALSSCEKGAAWRQAGALLGVLGVQQRCRLGADTISYNACISSCEKAEELGACLQLLTRMAYASVERDSITYNAAVSCAEKKARADVALRLLLECKASKVQLDDISFNTAVMACDKSGAWTEAMALLGELAQKAMEAAPRTHNAALSAVLSRPPEGIVVSNASSVEMPWSSVLRAMSDMNKATAPPDTITYNAALGISAKRSCWKVAVGLFEAAASCDVVETDLNTRVAVLFALAAGLRRVGVLSNLQDTAEDCLQLLWAQSKGSHQNSPPRPD